MKMNRNVIHNGKTLARGSDCPKDLESQMAKMGYAGNAVAEEKPAALAPEKVNEVKADEEKDEE